MSIIPPVLKLAQQLDTSLTKIYGGQTGIRKEV